MATTFQTILHEVAKHLNTMAGVNAVTQATNYAVSPSTATTINDAVITLGLQTDCILNTHGALALAIANARDPVTKIGNHPWRSSFRDRTASLAEGANLPIVGAGGKTIIGAYGAVYDAVDVNRVLTKASLERISKYKNNPTVYTVNPWLWGESGGQIWHTTTNVTIDVCVYERADHVSNFASGNIQIPDVLAWALIAGSVAQAIVAEKYMGQAAVFAGYYQAALDAIEAGRTDLPGLPVGLAQAA